MGLSCYGARMKWIGRLRAWWDAQPVVQVDLSQRPGWRQLPSDPVGVRRWWDGHRYTDETERYLPER